MIWIYSIQNRNEENEYDNLYYGPLTSFLIGGKNTTPLYDFMYNFFLEYLNHHNFLIDGHLINLTYRLAYEHNICGLKEQVDVIGKNNSDREALYNVINEEFNEVAWKRLLNNQIFHKMNWRANYKKYVNNKLTNYGYIVSKIKNQ